MCKSVVSKCSWCSGAAFDASFQLSDGGLDERCDGRPVLCSGIVARKQCILPVQCNPLDGSLDAVVVDLDATVGQEELETALELGDV